MNKSIYVGDLCYVFSDENWKLVCNVLNPIIEGNPHWEGGRLSFTNTDGKKVEIFIGLTAYGDGRYFPDDGNNPLLVDSGTLGCVSLDDCDEKDTSRFGLTLEGSVEDSFIEKKGVFNFGGVRVDTAMEDEDYEDDYEDDM